MGHPPGGAVTEPLIGRDRERAAIEEAVRRSTAGSGGLLLVGGDAGVGKTTLVEAVLTASDVCVLRGRAHGGGSVPYEPLRAALRDRASLSAGVLDAAEETPARIRHAFEQLAAQRPVVVFLDDLQWADAATFTVLSGWLDPTLSLPLLVIGAYRRDELRLEHPLRVLRSDLRRGGAGRQRHLSLEPLDGAASARLVTRLLGDAAEPDLVATLLRRAHGLPFYLEELATAVIATQEGDAPVAPSEALPESVRDVVAQRLDGLTAPARVLAELAAAARAPLPMDILGDLADEEEAVDELVSLGLLVELAAAGGTSEAGFRHDLVAEAVYAATPWSRRRRHHATLAGVLAAHAGAPAVLATHWTKAGDPARARPLLLAAAEAACQVHAYRDAKEAIDRALASWPVGDDEGGRLVALDRLGACAERCGEVSDAARALELVASAHRSAAAHEASADVERRLAGLYGLLGDWPRARAARTAAADGYRRAGRVVDAASERLAAAAHLQSAGDVTGALDLVRQAVAELEGGPPRGVPSSASAPGALRIRASGLEGLIRAKLGEGAAGVEMTRGAMDLALASGVDVLIAELYYLHADALEQATDYTAALGAWADASTFCRSRGLEADAHVCLACLVPALRHTGQWDRALEVGRELLARDDVPESARMVAAGEVGLVLANRGEAARSRRHLAGAAAFARATELFGLVVDASWGLARVDVLAGDDESAAARLRELCARCAERDERHYSVAALRWASSFFGRRGAREDLGSCTDLLARVAGATGTAEATAALAHALGETALLDGHHRGAADQFERTLELLRSVALPPETAETQVRAGVALVAAGDVPSGVERLLAAYNTARALGARPLATAALRELEALGEDVTSLLGRQPAPPGAAGLTPREREVLRLLAPGLTNRQIASDLFLSPRTVDMHVRNLLAKLDCRTRTEAVHRATELGVLPVGSP